MCQPNYIVFSIYDHPPSESQRRGGLTPLRRPDVQRDKGRMFSVASPLERPVGLVAGAEGGGGGRRGRVGENFGAKTKPPHPQSQQRDPPSTFRTPAPGILSCSNPPGGASRLAP